MKKLSKQQQKLQKQKQKRQQYWLYRGGALCSLVAIILAALWFANQNQSLMTNTANAAVISQGKQVYTTYCAGCHGVNLEGQPDWKQPFADGSFKAPPHDETGHTWHHSDAYLLESIRLGGTRLEANIGVSAMPAYADMLTEEEMEAVLIYIKSSWPADIREAQAARQ